ncbi:MAG: hypothetical protein GC151_19855 [Betaproteobacteria bacterium]|nr:hypothetical protein [Betaproteobacteria bacterium]
MNSPLTVLERYADAFRSLVNARVWGRDESPDQALRLNDRRDWEFICVAMDVVGDATLALQNFLRFSLDGPSRYEDVGERYLRLYGLLSAAYVQQQAVLKLYSLMNCPKPKEVQAEFNTLEIRTLRHQLASHSLDFLSPGGSKTQAFVPVRIGLSGFACMVTENRGSETRTVKLDDAILEHCKAVTSVIDRVYEKSAKTIFKGQSHKIAEFQDKLKDLRFVRDGNIILRGGDEENPLQIRIVFVGATK